jgi:Ca2+-binding EF-hand superfamily protein
MNLMQFDADKDGKLSREELPEQARGFFDQMDSNSDGFVDSAEIAELRRRMQGAGGPGGPGGPGVSPGTPGGTPGGGRPPAPNP